MLFLLILSLVSIIKYFFTPRCFILVLNKYVYIDHKKFSNIKEKFLGHRREKITESEREASTLTVVSNEESSRFQNQSSSTIPPFLKTIEADFVYEIKMHR